MNLLFSNEWYLLALRLLVTAFFSIVFLQSGIDKVIDRKGNLEWLSSHFSKSFFKGGVPFLFAILSVFEIISGLVCLAGFVVLLGGEKNIALFGVVSSAITLLMLFFGQRIAKDYAGASTLVNYFILAILSIVLLS
jgi:putative oxidoreductase